MKSQVFRFSLLVFLFLSSCAAPLRSSDGEPLDNLVSAWERDSPQRLVAFPGSSLTVGSCYLLQGQITSDNLLPGPPCRYRPLPDGRLLFLDSSGQPWALLRFEHPPHGTFFESLPEGRGEAHVVGRLVGTEALVIEPHERSRPLPLFECSSFCIWDGPFYDTGRRSTQQHY